MEYRSHCPVWTHRKRVAPRSKGSVREWQAASCHKSISTLAGARPKIAIVSLTANGTATEQITLKVFDLRW
jgi:hypothetical protein